MGDPQPDDEDGVDQPCDAKDVLAWMRLVLQVVRLFATAVKDLNPEVTVDLKHVDWVILAILVGLIQPSPVRCFNFETFKGGLLLLI